MTELDDVDRRVLYRLMEDARTTSAPEIAEEVGVSAGTVRNRIDKLEDAGVIRGYHADVDFERAEGRLTYLFICSAPIPERSHLARQVREVPGVVQVRELMAGQRNLHVTVVGEDTDEITTVARAIANLDVDIEDENVVETDYFRPYGPFGPPEQRNRAAPSDAASLTAEGEFCEVVVDEDARAANRTIADLGESDLADGVLVLLVERGDEPIHPVAETELRAGDRVTLFAPRGADDPSTGLFTATDA
ncbi:winged helix-turn-helix transcriptional regulator [Halobaculum sp. D14]|uniref:Lrp/AsnC family transcriptional regulator n=1 Tax=unclassified Halobaculum TaxID=2640896 RepID=UPI003EBEE456